jgi:hypothetical protein
MTEGEHVTAERGDEEIALLREIEACDVRLRFLTIAGYDEKRVIVYRQELLARRAEAAESLAALRKRAESL